MPLDDQATRSAARCSVHPGDGSVAVCHACGRPLCLTCAIPVRGEVFGSECLDQVLGPEPADAPRSVPSRPRGAVSGVAGLAFLGTVVSTAMPWTRFGVASGVFGAWGLQPLRWSMLSALAAAAGFVVWILFRRRGIAGRTAPLLLCTLAGATMTGAILHMYNPPPFTHAWLGPWVALGSGAIAAATCVSLSLRGWTRGPTPLD